MTNIRFETTTCDRCAGSGDYPSACWQGKCLKCGGRGRVLTNKGKAAKRKMLAWREAHMSTTAGELREGDRVEMSDPMGATIRATVATVEPMEIGKRNGVPIAGVEITVGQHRLPWRVETTMPFYRSWDAGALRRCYSECLTRMSGATLTD